jgi:anti-sigma B factor antagonist
MRVTETLMRAGEFVLEKKVERSAHTLVLAGELDLGTAYDLEAAVLQICADGAKELILDLSGLTFVDSAGLRALVSASSVCAEHGCALQLTRAREAVERLFELTGLAQALPFRREDVAGSAGDIA